MVPGNEYIAADLADTEKILAGQQELQHTLWVIFANGLGPVKEEFRIDIPLFIATSKVKYVGIALPKLVFREEACPYLSIEAGGNSYKTQVVADMDRVVQTEFRKDFEGILTRAIISATAKAAAQYALEEQNSSAASMVSTLMAIYSFATTAADVRIWTTLPKNFQVARLKFPDNKLIAVAPLNGTPFEIKIPDCKNAIIYVSIISQGVPPVYDVMAY
jgi:hypothetical protein